MSYDIPRISMVRSACIPTPCGYYDHQSLHVLTVGNNAFITVTGSNEDWTSDHCDMLYSLDFVPCEFCLDPKASAIRRFDEICFEMRLENQLDRIDELNNVNKLMEGDS